VSCAAANENGAARAIRIAHTEDKVGILRGVDCVESGIEDLAVEAKVVAASDAGREALLRVCFIHPTQRHVRLNEPRQIEHGSPRVFRL
jgi:hypothetical protein